MNFLSRSIAIGLLASTAFIMTGCDPDSPPAKDPSVFASIEDCLQAKDDDGGLANDPDDCKTAFESAKADHEKSAPSFPQRETCEQEYGVGQCVPRGSNNDSFMPMMMGVMIGQSMGGGGYNRVYAPVYINHGYAYTGTSRIGSAPVMPAGSTTMPRSYSVSRQGLGSTSVSSFSSHSSSVGMSSSSGASVSRGGFGGSAAGHASAGE
jgi:uncharacterized protein YgiB involved in biofilm formation